MINQLKYFSYLEFMNMSDVHNVVERNEAAERGENDSPSPMVNPTGVNIYNK
jgi:hypothetical protein